MNDQEYLDFNEAVAFLKTTPSTLYKWLQAEKVPGHKLGRQWRFLRTELEFHVSGNGHRVRIQKDLIVLHNKLQNQDENYEVNMNPSFLSVAEKLIWGAFDQGSRVIHIFPSGGRYQIEYRKQNGLNKIADLNEETFYEFQKSLNSQATGPDEKSGRRFYLHRGVDDILQVKLHELNTLSGPRLTLRLWKTEKDILPISKISSDEFVQRRFEDWLGIKKGLLLVSGETGSGKTTTVFSLINEFKKKNRAVFTLEESAEFAIEGIHQVEVKGMNQSAFLEAFEKIFASDPDVIVLGLGSYFGFEKMVFDSAYRAVQTGHIVVLQIDQGSCESAIQKFNSHCSYQLQQGDIWVSCQKLEVVEGKPKAIYEFSP